MEFTPHAATEIASPPAEGKGVNQPQPAAPLPPGYIEVEYLIGGRAPRFETIETPDDGMWMVKPGGEADYRTRVVVRRPSDLEAFDGVVLVDVTTIEASPNWGYLAEESAAREPPTSG